METGGQSLDLRFVLAQFAIEWNEILKSFWVPQWRKFDKLDVKVSVQFDFDAISSFISLEVYKGL